MLCVCKFDKLRDIGEASQSGFVDLSDLMEKGIVPSDLNVTEASFNQIDDPKAIYGRPSDQFEAITLAKDLEKRGTAAQKLYDERQAALAAAKE